MDVIIYEVRKYLPNDSALLNITLRLSKHSSSFWRTNKVQHYWCIANSPMDTTLFTCIEKAHFFPTWELLARGLEWVFTKVLPRWPWGRMSNLVHMVCWREWTLGSCEILSIRRGNLFGRSNLTGSWTSCLQTILYQREICGFWCRNWVKDFARYIFRTFSPPQTCPSNFGPLIHSWKKEGRKNTIEDMRNARRLGLVKLASIIWRFHCE